MREEKGIQCMCLRSQGKELIGQLEEELRETQKLLRTMTQAATMLAVVTGIATEQR